MGESQQVANKNWGQICAVCRGTGKNMIGDRCPGCNGLGEVQNGAYAPLASDFAMKEDMHREITVAKKPRIDFRGRAGPIRYARMKDFEITFEKTLDDMLSPNVKYAKGAEMKVRLALEVKGEELERERPDLYRRAVEQLTKGVRS